MSFWTPEEAKIIEDNRDLIEEGDWSKIFAAGLPIVQKLQAAFVNLGLDIYKGLTKIPDNFYRFTFRYMSGVTGVTLPKNVVVGGRAFIGTLIERVAVPASTVIQGIHGGVVEEIYYESTDGPKFTSKVAVHSAKFDKTPGLQVKLEPNYVYTTYDIRRDKIRVWGTDGVNPPAWVAFPEDLRAASGLVYKVDTLKYNGKNYRASGNIKLIQTR